MDDTTQNQNPVSQPVDPAVQQTQDMSAPLMPQAPVSPSMPVANPMPADPMDTAQVADLPMAPIGANPAQDASMPSASDTMGAMQQMATDPMAMPSQPIPSMDAVAPVMSTAPEATMPQPTDMSSLGPVTMEDLMEELQHIEDKLDEMDEKL